MTLTECIEEIDAIEPNAYSEEQKVKWVMQAEKSVATGIYLINAEDVGFPQLAESSPDYGFPLLVPSPFDKIYPLYLHAMIHYANSEYERYQNDMSLYNAAYGEFARWFAAKYEPALTKRKGTFSEAYREAERLFLPPCIGTGFSAVLGEDFTGDVDISVNGEIVVSVENGTETDYPVALWLPDGGEIVFTGVFSGEIALRGKTYRYGWPDEFGRMM